MAVETDAHGWISAPHHDGRLDGVMCVTNSEVNLHYRCTRGVRRVIRLLGVHQMDVSSFRNGNIILSVMVHSSEEAGLHASEEQLCRLGWGRPAALKGKYLFILDASYGAEIVADCDDVVVELDARPGPDGYGSSR